MPPKKRTKKPAAAVEEEDQASTKIKKNTKKQENNQEEEEEEKKQEYQSKSNQSSALGNGVFKQDIIRLSSWNLNGIRASNKNNDFINYIKKNNPDILCINESKVDKENFKKDKVETFIPKDYSAYWNFCEPPNKGYAGAAIFSKVAPISVKYDLGIQKHDQEGRTVTVEFEKFYLVACYVPNAGEGLKRLKYRTQEWDIDFQKYLNGLKQKKTTILCGDLNVAHQEIDLKNPKTNTKTPGFTPEERKGFTNFLSQGWIDTFRNFYPKEQKFSFWSYRSGGRKKNVGWRLDYFVVNKEGLKSIKSSTINNDIMGSDHCPIELEFINK